MANLGPFLTLNHLSYMVFSAVASSDEPLAMPLLVRLVNDHYLGENVNPLAYTTIKTVADRLVDAHQLYRQKHGKVFYYSLQANSLLVVKRSMAADICAHMFDGDRSDMMHAFMAMTDTDLKEAKQRRETLLVDTRQRAEYCRRNW